MFKISILLLFMNFSLGANQNICECKTYTEHQNFEQATFIFNGRALEKSYEFPNRIYKFSILYKYKNNYTQDEINILTTTDDCAPVFEIGKRYVIYANKIIDDKNIHLNKCHFHYELTDKNVNEEKHLQLMEFSKQANEVKIEEKAINSKRFQEKIESIHAEEVKDQKY